MDPKIVTLKNASTSNELKAAVDALPREEKYYTAEIRDAILEKKHLVVDAPSADAVASFVRYFSGFESKRELLRSAEIRDFIIDVLAPKISAGDPVEKLGGTICGVTYQNKRAAELYSNRKSFSAILDCFHRATTAGSARWIASSINNICYENPGANKILNDLLVVEAYSAIIPRATSDDTVRCISNSVAAMLNNNEPALKLFGTLAFIENVRTMEKYATSDDAKTSFKNVVDILQSIIDYPKLVKSLRDAATSAELKVAVDAVSREETNRTSEVLDAFLEKKHFLVDAQTADAIVSFVRYFSTFASKRDLLRTSAICDLIVDVLAPKISEGDPVENFGRAICRIAYQNKPAAELYSNPRCFSAILDCFHRATTAKSTEWIATSICNICLNNPGANKILKDLPVVEAYSAIIPYATTDDSVKWISNSINQILKDNEAAQILFGAPFFLQKFRSMEKYATSADAKTSFKNVIDLLRPIGKVMTDAASTVDNDALISQLREKVWRNQDAVLNEKDRQIEVAKNELKRIIDEKEAQLQQERDSWKVERVAFENQLELERAELLRTRNLLRQIKMELQDVELYYLKKLRQQNESGQRRQREDDEEEFKVKIEPGTE